MGEKKSALATGLAAMGNMSIPKLDFPRGCKYRSGQLEGADGWELDLDNPFRRFKVWHCRKFDKRMIWRDCRDADKEHSCAEVEDGAS